MKRIITRHERQAIASKTAVLRYVGLHSQASESTHTRGIEIPWFTTSTKATSVGTCPSIDNLSSLLSGWLAFAKLIVRS